MTPEGKIKRSISRLIDRYKGVYVFMPVPSGYGKSSLDYLLCVDGIFVAIEAKAPGKKPTDRQKKIMEDIKRAGGVVLLIDSEACTDLDRLDDILWRRAKQRDPDATSTS